MDIGKIEQLTTGNLPRYITPGATYFVNGYDLLEAFSNSHDELTRLRAENASLREMLQTIWESTTDTALKSKLAMWLAEQRYV